MRWIGRKAGVGWGEGAFFGLDFLGTFCVKTKSTKEKGQRIWQLQSSLLDTKFILSASLVLFCLDTKKNEKKSSTNPAPLPSASRLATHMPEWAALFVHVRAQGGINYQ